ncbi:MAG: hypothetical protein DHS20C15_24910 [Planctomycetota bacterium]|nr:MAG: hypothetical protein DHS20C15_24910 [Planctomycetota bacterium]
MPRSGLLASWLVLGLAVFLLSFEGWLPGQSLLPLAPGDFPAWSEGADDATLRQHPSPNYTMSDVLHLLIPGLATTSRAFARGELPLWDPSQALGLPHLDQVHYAVYYPPAWLPLLFGLRGLGLLVSLHLLLAAGGTLLYLRAIGRTPMAALFGAIAFGFSAWMTARAQSFPAIGAAVWLPWILLGLERAARGKPRFAYGLAAGGTALTLLAGFPQVALLVLSAAGFVELARWFWRSQRERNERRQSERRGVERRDVGHGSTAPDNAPGVLSHVRGEDRRFTLRGPRELPRAHTHFLRALLAFGFGMLLAAPQLLPTLDYLSNESDRAGQDLDAIVAEHLEAPLLNHLLVPDYFASSRLTGPHPLALGSLKQARQPVSLNRAETSMGIGVIGLLLACAALLFGRHWMTRTWSLLLLLVLALLLWPTALRVGASVLPPLRFGSPRRLLLLSSFALAVLAAGGLDMLRQARLRVAILCWVGALLLTGWALVLLTSVPATAEQGDLGVWARNLATQSGQPGITAEVVSELIPSRNFIVAAEDAFDGALLACLMGLAAVLLFRPRAADDERGWVTSAERLPALLVVLLLVQLLLEARPMLRPVRNELVSPEPASIGKLHVPPLAAALRAASSSEGVPTRFVRLGDDAAWLRPNFAGLFGLSDVSAYAPMVPRRVAELVDRLAPGARLSGSRLGGLSSAAQLDAPLLDLLGVDVVLCEDPEVVSERWEEREVVGGVRLLTPLEPARRARVVPSVRVEAQDDARLDALAAPDFDPDAVAYVNAPLEGLPTSSPGGLLPQRDLEWLESSPGHLVLEVGPGEAGLLVVAETFHGGWSAQLEERDLPVVAADHALIGVPLPAGEGGRVRLRFNPTSPGLGLWIGVAALLLFALFAWRGLFGRGVEFPEP